MTTSIRSMSIIAIFAAAAIVPVASAGASVNQPVLAGYSSGAPVDTSSGTSSVTALSHDYSSTPVDKSSGNSSLTSLSHDYSATPVETSSATSSLTALSHDSSPTVALHRDGSKAVPVVADLGPEPSRRRIRLGRRRDWRRRGPARLLPGDSRCGRSQRSPQAHHRRFAKRLRDGDGPAQGGPGSRRRSGIRPVRGRRPRTGRRCAAVSSSPARSLPGPRHG
jgi:hypothetical protein